MDHRVAHFAAHRHGVASFGELLALGLGEDAIDHRVRAGRLHRVHRGVYAVGHPAVSLRGRWRAAVLAAGDGAVLSHGDAAALWDLRSPGGRLIHVTRPSSGGRDPDRARIRLHRVRTLRPFECTLTDDIPATTVARTLLDLSPHLGPRALEDVIARADRLSLFDLVAVRRCLDEHPRQHGAPKLRQLLDDLHGGGITDLRSELEVRMLQLCDDHGLPTPRVNVPVEGWLVDFLWPDARLVVETDGYAHHTTRTAFERDRERDQQLVLAGYTVLRFTYKQVVETSGAVADRLRRLVG